ncbi:helix-turn-helix domain-containing protein [Plebeiibacterium marinum]|uniref:Helix-turn-helix domain-containing protein n=1 Tax=Plebeiibacterium marinum TaxID=2992111 RepID=A0AAE3MCW3_9BACT|nr:helix-turn-helix domain-containing protein [Plebeiobacterium marinum]MCW3805242.1 helix-turn-helix domain-containing protein [Plebeiobacterium marinum]
MEKKLDLTQIVSRFINNTNQNIFLTGKAGTGKTTLLRNIHHHTHKSVVVAAPTGIAAINAQGVTLHSLFQLPFGAFAPDNNALANKSVHSLINTPRTLLANVRLHKNKRNMLKKMELLIIDEVSMLRADILDSIDLILRSVRQKRDVPFGGVQVMFIGDMLQLPPVVKDDEWNVLSAYYPNAFFFNAQVVRNNPPLYIELEKIYRQSDKRFVGLLNNLRDNCITEEDILLLNKYYKPDYKQKPDDGIILLTTHNRIANDKNQRALNEINEKSIFFKADVKGDFNEYSYPTDESLEFKKGAQVMFTKNDYSGEQRYFNGKIGFITKLNKEEIEVSFTDGSEPAQVEPYVWENKKFAVNKETNAIEEEVVGTFQQYPLKLAWAITVHKSQGLTFEKAIIDVANAFAPGQIYVALSRLSNLDGLVLTSPIPKEGISIDQSLKEFALNKKGADDLEPILEAQSKLYFNNFVLRAFDFTDLMQELYYHISTYSKDGKKSSKQQYKSWAQQIAKETEPLKKVADTFQAQVNTIVHSNSNNYLPVLLERVDKAVHYFEPLIKELHDKVRAHCQVLRGARGVKTYYNELVDLSNLFLGQLQLIYKAHTLIESSIKGTEFSKELVKNPEFSGSRNDSVSAKATNTTKVKEPKEKKPDTKTVSYDLYKAGKTLEEIAKERSLTMGTIEGHLAHYVQIGEVDIYEFISKEKLNIIEKEIHKQDTFTLSPIKESLGKGVSYGEIKMVVAYMQKDKV